VVVITGAAVAFGLGAGAGTTFGAGGTTLAGVCVGFCFGGSASFTSGFGYEYLKRNSEMKLALFNSKLIFAHPVVVTTGAGVATTFTTFFAGAGSSNLTAGGG
jgi:hypothetical protein